MNEQKTEKERITKKYQTDRSEKDYTNTLKTLF